jgi:hypothetical protein
MMKILKPLPHAIMDYAWAGMMMASPWLFGFKKNRVAAAHAVASGGAILGLSLMTRYPLGVFKYIPFPVHGVIETIAGATTATSPWLMGFADDDRARMTHVVSGLMTFAVVAMTDYKAADGSARRQVRRGAGLAEQMRNQPIEREERVNLGPPADYPLAS